MTLYDEFIQTIKATQDKKVIIDNMLKGKKYTAVKIEKYIDKPNTLKIEIKGNIHTLPDFLPNEIYLPSLNSKYELPLISYHLKKHLEISLCQPYEINSFFIYIDIQKSLQNFKENKKPFHSHQVSFYNTPKQLKFHQNYYSICNYIKEVSSNSEKEQYAFVLNFDYVKTKFNLKIVPRTNFEDFEYLFFLEDKKLLKEHSNLFFHDKEKSTIIDIEKTMKKIDLFNKIKDF